MDYVNIGAARFSRLICGSNPLYGHSHFSAARDAEYLARFDDEATVSLMRRAMSLGIDTVESCANERIVQLMARAAAESGTPLRFVGSTRVDETSPMQSHQEKLDFLLERRADICLLHSQFVDRPRRSREIRGLMPLVDRIHAAGLLAGISTHSVDTVQLCEEKGYEVDVYLFPLNASGFVYPGYEGSETVQDRVDTVRDVPRPFILIKTLGAGRIPPEEALSFVAEHAKPTDLVSLGLGTEAELEECVAVFERCFHT